MKRALFGAGLLLGLSPFLLAQNEATTTTSNNQSDHQVTTTHRGADVRTAQKELKKQGYDVGPVDGIMGPKTKSAIQKFQADKKLTQTGRLDAATMRDLRSGGTAPVPTAATNLGSHTKEAGHDIKTGHPVEAGKTFGTGAANMGKSVGHESKSVASKGAKKVHKGMDVLSKKIYGTTGDDSDRKADDSNAKTPDQTKGQGSAVGQPAQSPNTPK